MSLATVRSGYNNIIVIDRTVQLFSYPVSTINFLLTAIEGIVATIGPSSEFRVDCDGLLQD